MDINETRAALMSGNTQARLFDPFGETTQNVKLVGYSTVPSALVELEDGSKRLVRIKDLRPFEPEKDLSEEELRKIRALFLNQDATAQIALLPPAAQRITTILHLSHAGVGGSDAGARCGHELSSGTTPAHVLMPTSDAPLFKAYIDPAVDVCADCASLFRAETGGN